MQLRVSSVFQQKPQTSLKALCSPPFSAGWDPSLWNNVHFLSVFWPDSVLKKKMSELCLSNRSYVSTTLMSWKSRGTVYVVTADCSNTCQGVADTNDIRSLSWILCKKTKGFYKTFSLELRTFLLHCTSVRTQIEKLKEGKKRIF